MDYQYLIWEVSCPHCDSGLQENNGVVLPCGLILSAAGWCVRDGLPKDTQRPQEARHLYSGARFSAEHNSSRRHDFLQPLIVPSRCSPAMTHTFDPVAFTGRGRGRGRGRGGGRGRGRGRASSVLLESSPSPSGSRTEANGSSPALSEQLVFIGRRLTVCLLSKCKCRISMWGVI